MRQSLKQPAVTRQAILSAAGAEFSHHGYAGAGIGAIVGRAGLTKGALFHHFPDKQALAVAWVGENIAATIRTEWVLPLEGVGSLDGMRAFCRARCMEIEPADAVSALVSLTAGTAVGNPALSAAVDAVFDQWRDAVAGVLEGGKTAGWIHPSIQPADEAEFLVSAFCGFTVTTKCSGDERTKRTCARTMETYLETLRPQ